MDKIVEDELPNEYLCPICFELLSGEIFQCVNGHTVCHECVRPLQPCPTCRIPYNGNISRVRVLENLLDRMTFSCKFKAEGCVVQLKRAEVSTHNETCEYGGASIRLCEVLGLACSKVVNTRRMGAALDHLITEHHAKCLKEPKVRLQLKEPYQATGTINAHFRQQWFPFILESGDPSSKVVVSIATAQDCQGISLETLVAQVNLAPDPAMKEIEAEFGIPVAVNGKNETIVWNQAVEDIKDSIDWRRTHMIRFGRQSFKEYFVATGLKLDCKLLIDGFGPPLQHPVNEIILFKVPPSNNTLTENYHGPNVSRGTISNQAPEVFTTEVPHIPLANACYGGYGDGAPYVANYQNGNQNRDSYVEYGDTGQNLGDNIGSQNYTGRSQRYRNRRRY